MKRTQACTAIGGLSHLVLLAGLAAGCDDHPAANAAPTASALQATVPASAAAKKLSIDKATSKVELMMEAPVEKIRGRVSGATEGDIQVDPSDVTKTTGLLAVDLSGLEVFQTKADDKGAFGKEEKSDLQNKHARNWLEIADDVPEVKRKENARAEFAIRSIDKASDKDVSKMTGADRKVTLTATGDFRLHGRKAEKSVELEATFHYEGDKLAQVAVKTAKPFAVSLDEHDVRPREFFGKLAQKTLSDLSPKVAKEALVSLEVTAVAPK